MSDDREQPIRNRAYESWEAEGQPKRAQESHRHRASTEQDGWTDGGGGPAVPGDAVPGDAVAADAVPRVPPADSAPGDRGGAPAEQPPVTAPGRAAQGAHVAGADGTKARGRTQA